MLFRADAAEREERRQGRQLDEMKKWIEQSPALKADIYAKLATVLSWKVSIASSSP
jgi:hypothetical protein